MTRNWGYFVSDNQVAFEREFNCSNIELWELIATKEGLSKWFMPTSEEIKEGNRFSFENGWNGTIAQVDNLSSIRFNADMTNKQEYDEKTGGFLVFEILDNEDMIKFRLSDKMASDVDASKIFSEATTIEKYQPGGVGTHWSGVLAGYHGFVDALEEVITSKSVEIDWELYHQKYVEILDEQFQISYIE